MQRLLGIKPIYIFIRYAWIAFFLFTTLDHACTTCFVFANSFWKIFSKFFLQIVKGIWIRLQIAFSRFEIFSPCFKCFSFDLNKTPPGWKSPLSVQEGFTNWKKTKYFRYQFEKSSFKYFIIRYQFKTSFKTRLKLVVVRSFCFGLYSLPLWH